jgi:hypothetical protein
VPPVDPKVVDALHKALRETGCADTPRLILIESTQTQESEVDTVSEWPLQPCLSVIPSLFALAREPALQSGTEEEDELAPGPLLGSNDVTDWLREAIEALRKGQSVEVDDPKDLSHAEARMTVAGASLTVLAGLDGTHFLVVALRPESTGDVRAIQRIFNERILRWITAQGEVTDDDFEDEANEADSIFDSVADLLP